MFREGCRSLSCKIFVLSEESDFSLVHHKSILDELQQQLRELASCFAEVVPPQSEEHFSQKRFTHWRPFQSCSVFVSFLALFF